MFYPNCCSAEFHLKLMMSNKLKLIYQPLNLYPIHEVPKYKQLASDEKELYHFEKDKYNETARLGPDSLYFA